ncbi:hypothetical protein BJX65DRAFT_263682 [Aspergillus insuetus]
MLRLSLIPSLPPFRRPVARGKAGWLVARSRTKPRFPFLPYLPSPPFNLALLPSPISSFFHSPFSCHIYFLSPDLWSSSKVQSLALISLSSSLPPIHLYLLNSPTSTQHVHP